MGFGVGGKGNLVEDLFDFVVFVFWDWDEGVVWVVNCYVFIGGVVDVGSIKMGLLVV